MKAEFQYSHTKEVKSQDLLLTDPRNGAISHPLSQVTREQVIREQMGCVHAKSLQLCPTSCHSVNCSPPGSSVHGVLQARIPGVGCQALLQGIFQTQGWNSHLLLLLHWQVGSLPLAPPGKPKRAKWQAPPTYKVAGKPKRMGWQAPPTYKVAGAEVFHSRFTG